MDATHPAAALRRGSEQNPSRRRPAAGQWCRMVQNDTGFTPFHPPLARRLKRAHSGRDLHPSRVPP